jgi:hypothetical protein
MCHGSCCPEALESRTVPGQSTSNDGMTARWRWRFGLSRTYRQVKNSSARAQKCHEHQLTVRKFQERSVCCYCLVRNNSIAPGPRSHSPDNVSEGQFGAGTQADGNVTVCGRGKASRPCPKIPNAEPISDLRRVGFNCVETIVAHFHSSYKKLGGFSPSLLIISSVPKRCAIIVID